MSRALEKQFEDLALIESVLVLALRSPLQPTVKVAEIPAVIGLDNQKAVQLEIGAAQELLGKEYKDLRDSLHANSQELRRLMSTYLVARGSIERMRHTYTLMAESWGGTQDHRAGRWGLIELLIELRRELLDSMRSIPTSPSAAENAAKPQNADQGRVMPTWGDLSKRQREILDLLADGDPLQGKTLAIRLGLRPGALTGPLKALRDCGILRNIPRSGYKIQRLPEGLPSSWRASGH